MLLYYLWYQLAHTFGVSDSTAHQCTSKLIDVLYDHYRHVFIRWPTGDRLMQTTEDFRNKREVDGVIGAIDGSHIPISTPSTNGAGYVNREGFHTLCHPASSLHEWPAVHGCVHRLARVSSWCTGIPRLTSAPSCVHQRWHSLSNGTFLLGDAAYRLISQVMTPAKDTGAHSRPEVFYNFCYSSTRMVIERAFGLLIMKHLANG